MPLVRRRPVAQDGSGLAASPLGRALRRLAQKQLSPGPPGGDVGWRSLRGRARLPRSIQNYLDTYGGTEDSVVWVYACASLIADELSGYPWDILDPEDNVLQPNEVPQELADLLNQPEQLLTYPDWLTYIALDLELGGNSYWLKDRQNGLGQPFELLRLRPEYVRRAVNQQGRPIGHVYEIQGRQIPFSLDDIVWYRYPDPREPLYGIGTVEAIMRELGADLAMREHVVGFYSQGGRISGVVTVQGGLNEQQFERLERQFEEDAAVVGTDFRLLIIEQGNKFDPVTQAPSDTNVVPLGRMTKDRILTGFKVPEPLLGGVLENANYKITDSRYVFARRIQPKATRISERTTLDLVELWDGLQYRIDVTVSEAPHERAERVKNERGSGVSLNQMLDDLGKPTIDDPLADEPLIAQDLLPASVVLGLQEHPAVAARPQPISVVPAPLPVGAEPTQGEPAPNEPPPGTEPSQLPGKGLRRMRATRPRTPAQRRPRRAKSRWSYAHDAPWEPPHLQRRSVMAAIIDAQQRLGRGGGADADDVLALPPAPQDQGYPIQVPPLPEGYEQLGEVIIRRADATMAVRLLAHRHDLLRRAFPVWHRAFLDFFVAQRGRVLQRLDQFGGSSRAVREGRKKRKDELTADQLWDDKAERDALLGVYLPLADKIGVPALEQVGELIGSGLRWDLQVPVVRDVRARIADKVTRINDSTRGAIAKEVEVGLQRGYSVVQIANGVPAEAYNGIVGVFDQASRYRAEMIARSETAMVYNDTANAGYRDGGITEVEVIDGDGDEECADANGSVWTLDEAEANPIAHPNCVRAFAPIMGGAGATSVTTYDLPAAPTVRYVRSASMPAGGVVTAEDLKPGGMMCGNEGCNYVFEVGDPYVLVPLAADIGLVVCIICGADPASVRAVQ